MGWELLGKNLEHPPLLWSQFLRVADNQTVVLYFGAASRVWYSSQDYGGGASVEQFIALLTPEDLAAATAAAIAYRREE